MQPATSAASLVSSDVDRDGDSGSDLASEVVAATPECAASTISISARELHELMLEMHATANLTRKRFMDALRSLSEQRLYLQLGHPTIAAYAEATFGFRKSRTYEFLRVSEALQSLPRIAAAYEIGKLSFSLVAELTRVADAESEDEWLDLANSKRVGEVTAEVRDAIRNKRTHPRKGGFGLPGLPVRLNPDYSREEWRDVVDSCEIKESEGRRPEAYP